MDIQEIARNTFTVAALLLTANIVLLNYFWKRLKDLLNSMPVDKRRIMLCGLKSISDPVELDKYTYINMQFLACIFIVLSLAGALIAVSFMPGIMVGDITGLKIIENFEFAVVAMRASGLFMLAAFIFAAYNYLEDIIAIYTGKPCITTTPLEQLPKRELKNKVFSHILFGLFQAYVVALFLIDFLIPFNQWCKMAIAFAVGILLIICVRFARTVYMRCHNKKVSTHLPIPAVVEAPDSSITSKQK